MKFFIPGAQTPEMAEKIWSDVRKIVDQTMGRTCTDRRIFRLDFEYGPKTFEAEVGRVLEPVYEAVIQILESDGLYFICTMNRGVAHGTPVLVGAKSVLSVMDFEEEVKV